MRVGCCAYSYREYLTSGKMTLEQFIDLASDLGVDGVELTAYYFASTDNAYLDKIKRHALRRGVDIAGTAVGNRFTWSQASKREEHVAMVKQWIDCSVRLGAPYLRVFAGRVADDSSEEQAFAWTVAALKACVPYAASRGVLLALENHGGITSTAEQVFRLLDAVDSPWLVVNLDTGNYRQSPYEEIAQTVPKAVTAHVKTEIVEGDKHVPVDTRRVLTTLHEAGYRGFLNIEYEAHEDPKTAVPRFIQEIRDILADLKLPRYDWAQSDGVRR